ncbi:MAG TPA: hypothetical protein VH934_14365 [Xanthobacteraceae bacterium]
MQVGILPAVAVAVALAALIAAWAETHFNELLPLGEIRFAVPQQRYFAALGAHVAAILAIYALLVVAAYVGMVYVAVARTVGSPFDCFQGLATQPSANCAKFFTQLRTLNGNALVWSALAAALFLRLVVPNVALTRRFIDRLRDQTHDLALYPFARQSLIAALSASKFAIREGADAQLLNELDRYGVGPELMSFMSPSAKQSLIEVCSLRRQLTEALNPLQSFAQVLQPRRSTFDKARIADASPPPEVAKFASARALQQFGQVRANNFARLETDFRRLIRRTALALLLAEEIGAKIEGEALYRAISNFVAEECDDVLARYRGLVAEVALSCVPHRAERMQFLKSFGYDVLTPPALPLYPWVIVFSLDFLLFLVPSLVMLLGGQSPNVGLSQLATFACVHAISQTVALTWAIYPKTVSNFARPSPYSLPLQSYAVFGLASYVSGAIILLIFRLIVPIPFPVLLPTLVSAISFLLMTVGTSVLIDLRLQSRSLDFQHGRVREGLIMAAVMVAGTASFQLLIFYVFPWFGWINAGQPPNFFPGRALFFVLSAGLGFVMGYYVPAATAAFLQRAHLLRLPDIGGRGADSRTGASASWDTRLSPQA